MVDYSKPIMIPVGTDSLEQIGAPPGESHHAVSQTIALRAWRDNWIQTFPMTDTGT